MRLIISGLIKPSAWSFEPEKLNVASSPLISSRTLTCTAAHRLAVVVGHRYAFGHAIRPLALLPI